MHSASTISTGPGTRRSGASRLRLAGLAVVLAAPLLASGEGAAWGLQAGLRAPLQGDLRVTTGSGLDPAAGVHLDWGLGSADLLRARVDLGSFVSADRTAGYPGVQQSIHTQVRDQAVGVEWLHRFGAARAWQLGAGAQLIRWTVDSDNRLDTASGSFLPSGSRSWTRPGLGVLAGYRWNRHAETEVRVIASHYGEQKLPVRLAALNLIWTF